MENEPIILKLNSFFVYSWLNRSGFVVQLSDNVPPYLTIVFQLFNQADRKHIFDMFDISIVVLHFLLKNQFYFIDGLLCCPASAL